MDIKFVSFMAGVTTNRINQQLKAFGMNVAKVPTAKTHKFSITVPQYWEFMRKREEYKGREVVIRKNKGSWDKPLCSVDSPCICCQMSMLHGNNAGAV